MITISKEAYIQGNNPTILLPGVPEGNYEVVIVLQLRTKGTRRRAGFSKARFVMEEDFNAPLEDFKEYMEIGSSFKDLPENGKTFRVIWIRRLLQPLDVSLLIKKLLIVNLN